MEQYTQLELILGAIAIAEALLLIYLWIRNNARHNAVILEPGKDKLRVDYWWIDERDITDNPDLNLEKLYRTTNDEEEIKIYVYDVEGTETLVSKAGSNAVSTKIGAIKPPSKKPPPILMAIEIKVVEREH